MLNEEISRDKDGLEEKEERSQDAFMRKEVSRLRILLGAVMCD
jgi:hypothetical protein